jgi:hypothetical protein
MVTKRTPIKTTPEKKLWSREIFPDTSLDTFARKHLAINDQLIWSAMIIAPVNFLHVRHKTFVCPFRCASVTAKRAYVLSCRDPNEQLPI